MDTPVRPAVNARRMRLLLSRGKFLTAGAVRPGDTAICMWRFSIQHGVTSSTKCVMRAVLESW